MKRSLSIAAALMGLAWLIATGVLLFYVANLAPIQALLVALVTQDAAFGICLALFITTNTRRAWDAPDPYAEPTAVLLRGPLLREEDRRVTSGTIDDRNVVQRLSDMLEEEAAKRPPSERTPPWAIEIASEHARADDMFGETPSEEL
jgi:hypothetical protein